MKRWMFGVLRDDEPEAGGGNNPPEQAPSPEAEVHTDNIDPVQELVRTQRAEIERVTRENKRLRKKIRAERENSPVATPAPAPHNEPGSERRKSVFDAFFGRD